MGTTFVNVYLTNNKRPDHDTLEYNESRLFLITRAWSSPKKMIDSQKKKKYSVTRTPLESQPKLGYVIFGGSIFGNISCTTLYNSKLSKMAYLQSHLIGFDLRLYQHNKNNGKHNHIAHKTNFMKSIILSKIFGLKLYVHHIYIYIITPVDIAHSCV